MSLKLVTLNSQAPVSCTLDELAVGWSDADARAIGKLGVRHGLGILRDAQGLAKVGVDPDRAARWIAAAPPSLVTAVAAP
jgi:hypothetical protein